MGFNSQSGLVGFGLQSGKGTAHAATRFARLRSGGMAGDRDLLIPDPEIGGNRDIPGAYLGPIAFNGDYEFYPRMEILALLAKAAFGASASSATSATNEGQTITTTGTPTGGSFKLKFRGIETAAIPFDSTAATVAAALVTAGTASGLIVTGDVTGAGGPLPGTPVVLTFHQQYAGANVPAITVSDNVSQTGGTTPSTAATTSTSGIPPIGTHIITPADTLPWLTVEERIATDFESFQYVDTLVNSLKINCEAGGYFMGSVNLSALTQTADFTEQVNPSWDTTPLTVGSQVQVYFNSVLLPAKTFDFELSNNIELDDFVLGSVFRNDMTPKRREVKASLSYRPADDTLWKAAMFGSSAVSVAGAGPGYQAPMRIIISSYETIGLVNGGTKFSVTIDIPNAILHPYKVNPSGDDVIQTDLEITAARPDSAIPIVTMTVVNDLATIS